MQNICVINYKSNKEEKNLTKIEDTILQNIEDDFTSEEYNTSNIDKGKDEILNFQSMTITLTTTQNQFNNINNTKITIIDLGGCESILKKENNIPDNEIIYIKKIDVLQEGYKIPKIEYEVYSKYGVTYLKKLNLSVCEKSKVSLIIPVKIEENIEKLNMSSRYYNDLCYTSMSDFGTDINLKDRKKEFIEGNKTVCEEGCDFEEYDYINEKAKCSCKVKLSLSSFSDIKINKTKLYQNFIDIKNIANIKIMVCYKQLFSIDGIIHNIAFYSILSIIIFHFITIIVFYYSQKKLIDNKIKDIFYGINNLDLIKEDKKEKE